MSGPETAPKGNDEYLAAVVEWIHLRLKRLAEGPDHRPSAPATQPAQVPHVPRESQPIQPPISPIGTGTLPISQPLEPENWWVRLFRARGPQQLPSQPPGPPQKPVVPGSDILDSGGSEPRSDGVWVADSAGNVVVPTRVYDELLVQAEAKMQAAADALEPAPPALLLQWLFDMSNFERDLLLLCAAIELDTRTAALCAQAQGGARPYPTFALAMALFDNPAWEVLSPERPLRLWRMIEIASTEGQSLMTSPLRADERILNFLKGLNYLDERLSPFLSPLPIPTDDTTGLAPSQKDLADEIARGLQASGQMSGKRLPVVQLVGPETIAKQRVASEAARQFGLALYRLSIAALPAQQADLDNWIHLWQRETSLLPVGLVLDAGETDDRASGGSASHSVMHFLSHLRALVFLISREPWGRLGGDTLIFEVEKPTPAEQAEAWSDALGPDAGPAPTRLAGQFSLDLVDIERIVDRQMALGRTDLPDLWQASLQHCRSNLDLLAQRVGPRSTWADIVLPEASYRLLQEIADQVHQRSRVYDEWGFRQKMSRGLGISVLFDGESGTGKTMAAEVIASHLHLDLYRIDLSAVVSKYIGQTEKNLRSLFDSAEDGGMLLFFDEADALFGKRSEVKDSHDRYANIEVNYLLQRMEAYSGLAILATNMRSALDPAFVRRLRFVVKFPVPGPEERRTIWTKVFPPETPLELEDPVERIDYDRLAKVSFPGGSINNAALNAAFLAARAGTKVTMSLLVQAIQTELKKMDRPVQPI